MSDKKEVTTSAHNSMRSVGSKGRSRASIVQFRYWRHLPKRICQTAVRSFWFWIAVAVCTLLEPILCSQPRTVGNVATQSLVLAISTILYIIQLVGVATTEWDRIKAVKALGQFGSVISFSKPDTHRHQMMIVKLFAFFTTEGEFLVEGAMLLAGWILIYWHPGLATLRCFRVFRLLWFYEVSIFKITVTKYLSPYFGDGFVKRAFKVFKFAIKALSALGDEIFRLTPETRGGLLLIMMIFYSAFVLGAAIYVETNGEGTNCESIGMCTFTLMRLSFFDGNGFDFAFYLAGGYKILFFIVMLYMCITSFGIINGLVGIFGTLFATASAQAFEEEDEEGRYGNLGDDDEDDDSFEDGGDTIAPVEGSEDKLEAGSSLERDDGDGDGDGDGDDKAEKIEPLGKFTKAQRQSAANLMAAVEGNGPPMSETQIESHLKEILGTKKVSHYAVAEFQNLQASKSPVLSPRAESFRASPQGMGSAKKSKSNLGLFSPVATAPASTGRKSKFSIRDVALRVKKGKVDGDMELFRVGEDSEQLEAPLTPGENKPKPKPMGMFAVPMKQHAVVTEGRHSDFGRNDLRTLTSQVAQLHQKIDQQHDLIQNMFQTMLQMQKQLSANNHPPTVELNTPAGV